MGVYINHLNPQLAAAVNAATTLEGLHETIQQAMGQFTDDENANLDLSMLPTLGGEAPRDCYGVWSWDEQRLLVGDGAVEDWRIVSRAEWDARA